MTRTETKLRTTVEIDMDAWVRFRMLVQEVSDARLHGRPVKCQRNRIVPDSDPEGDPLNQITRTIVDLLTCSGSLYPTSGDQAWDVLRDLVEKAVVVNIEVQR